MKPCVFFDRDGIVNVAPITRYVEKLSDFRLQEGFFEALKVALDRGYSAVIVTNQKGVSTGFIPLDELKAMHKLIRDEAARRGLSLLDIFYCDATEDSDPRRKPNPGMLLEAAEKYGIDLARSWMIGDNESDILAGQRAGCRTVYVGAKHLSVKPNCEVANIEQLKGALCRVLRSA